MAQTDPEDGFDQIMAQSWNSVTQQLRTLHNELSGDRARRRERAEHTIQSKHYGQTRRQQQSIRLEQWEMDNKERLNKESESTLNATVLADGGGWRKICDSSLLQGWMVADQLEDNDPGYRRQIIEAKARLRDEWSKRHPETHIDTAADRLIDHVNIAYTDQSPALQATLNAFNTAGAPVDLQRVEDARAFQAAHSNDVTFFVDSQLTGQWTGYGHDRIVGAVMCAPVNGVDDAASRISFLEDQGLLESSYTDNKATGDEPSTISEVERTGNADAAPIVETPTLVREHTRPAADERKPASGPEPETTGGGDPTTGEPDGYEEMPLDLNGPEKWNGSGLFSECSPAMESSMNPTDQPIPDQASVSTPQILQPEASSNAC